VIEYHQALDLIINAIEALEPVKVSITDAVGRILAENIPSRFDLPPLNNSAMDGFAFAATSVPENLNLSVSGFVAAGSPEHPEVPPGSAVRIMTGAVVPAGCDTVIPLEDVSCTADRVTLPARPQAGTHIRRQGEEVRRGETVLSVGDRLDPGSIGLLAAAGHTKVRVYPAPRVAILATGDELVQPGKRPGYGQIIDSNTMQLAARLQEEGYQPELLGIARDDRQDLETKLVRGLACDMLITSGGVSAGDYDLVQEVLKDLGFERKFWKVNIKPGKPVLFGQIGALPVFGLPGNPAATAITYELFVRPALRRLSGCNKPYPLRIRVRLGQAIKGGKKRLQFLLGRFDIVAGEVSFIPTQTQASGQKRHLHGAHALLPVATDAQPLPAGATVEVILIRFPAGCPGASY